MIYVPMTNRPALARNYGNEHDTMFIDSHFYWVDIMGRLRPGITLARAQTELAAQFHQFDLASAANDKERADLPALWVEEGGSGVDSLRRQYSKPLFVLMTMVAFILAIACANIANLLLARATARRREIAVRLSLGASRRRVLRQLLTESVMLALPGGILGLGVAAAGIRFLIWLLGSGREEFRLQARNSTGASSPSRSRSRSRQEFFSGSHPPLQRRAWISLRRSRRLALAAPRRHGRRIGLSQFLVVSQIALSLLLVLGAAIFVRTLANLHSVEIGFNQESLLTFSLDASQAGYKDAALKAFYARMDEQFRALPGVRAATVSDMPLVANWPTVRLTSSFQVFPNRKAATARAHPIFPWGPRFSKRCSFRFCLAVPLARTTWKVRPSPPWSTKSLRRSIFPTRIPSGGNSGWATRRLATLTIVGVAKNARYNSLKEAIPPVAYISYLQNVSNVRRTP